MRAEENKKKKRRKKKDTQNSGKLAICPDHPRRRIKIKLCMVGGFRCAHVKGHSNRLRGYGAVGRRKWPFPITLANGLYNSLYYHISRDRWHQKEHMASEKSVVLEQFQRFCLGD